MSRWRPPGEASSTLITAAGLARLQRELDELWRVRRPEVVAALSAAAAEGDRSENAEYIYRKKQLGEIDRRIRYLGKRIPTLRPAIDLPRDQQAIFFGAWFSVESVDGTVHAYRVVGADEIDAERGWISIDAPMARAALKKRVGDEFEVLTPGGAHIFLITQVSYEGSE
ncbi:MAG: transcription elongation factor GreB [Dokdonella sp.]|jgi:transcription elongation factor GreB|uniref:transcription elongation factor GreB n=1 Tax=Dokdonella sp. TaxID=2291710 RepID=UPI001B66E3B4|nr:transcription elongation factor GreB [Dokdonella sp.]MCC6441230.1 transcription elongation factor GreB [Rhodanobacteraceae bacterium]MBK8124575.1 transcription elongation factor GreB [Dokdonella sp.]MBP6325769.1 transcription elongation factor GreB [Dokdonella sp.]HNV07350.1 transcription elongation factor GreB [Dokdonella sp.]HQV48074.1 transcription elongation factor GreB [Dokdonella sp.]